MLHRTTRFERRDKLRIEALELFALLVEENDAIGGEAVFPERCGSRSRDRLRCADPCCAAHYGDWLRFAEGWSSQLLRCGVRGCWVITRLFFVRRGLCPCQRRDAIDVLPFRYGAFSRVHLATFSDVLYLLY